VTTADGADQHERRQRHVERPFVVRDDPIVDRHTDQQPAARLRARLADREYAQGGYPGRTLSEVAAQGQEPRIPGALIRHG
jgi:hypothetical protein